MFFVWAHLPTFKRQCQKYLDMRPSRKLEYLDFFLDTPLGSSVCWSHLAESTYSFLLIGPFFGLKNENTTTSPSWTMLTLMDLRWRGIKFKTLTQLQSKNYSSYTAIMSLSSPWLLTCHIPSYTNEKFQKHGCYFIVCFDWPAFQIPAPSELSTEHLSTNEVFDKITRYRVGIEFTYITCVVLHSSTCMCWIRRHYSPISRASFVSHLCPFKDANQILYWSTYARCTMCRIGVHVHQWLKCVLSLRSSKCPKVTA